MLWLACVGVARVTDRSRVSSWCVTTITKVVVAGLCLLATGGDTGSALIAEEASTELARVSNVQRDSKWQLRGRGLSNWQKEVIF